MRVLLPAQTQRLAVGLGEVTDPVEGVEGRGGVFADLAEERLEREEELGVGVLAGPRQTASMTAEEKEAMWKNCCMTAFR